MERAAAEKERGLVLEDERRMEAERLRAEELRRVEAERLRAEELRRVEAERLRAEELRRREMERVFEELRRRREAERLEEEARQKEELRRLARKEAKRRRREEEIKAQAELLKRKLLETQQRPELKAEQERAEAEQMRMKEEQRLERVAKRRAEEERLKEAKKLARRQKFEEKNLPLVRVEGRAELMAARSALEKVIMEEVEETDLYAVMPERLLEEQSRDVSVQAAANVWIRLAKSWPDLNVQLAGSSDFALVQSSYVLRVSDAAFFDVAKIESAWWEAWQKEARQIRARAPLGEGVALRPGATHYEVHPALLGGALESCPHPLFPQIHAKAQELYQEWTRTRAPPELQRKYKLTLTSPNADLPSPIQARQMVYSYITALILIGRVRDPQVYIGVRDVKDGLVIPLRNLPFRDKRDLQYLLLALGATFFPLDEVNERVLERRTDMRLFKNAALMNVDALEKVKEKEQNLGKWLIMSLMALHAVFPMPPVAVGVDKPWAPEPLPMGKQLVVRGRPLPPAPAPVEPVGAEIIKAFYQGAVHDGVFYSGVMDYPAGTRDFYFGMQTLGLGPLLEFVKGTYWQRALNRKVPKEPLPLMCPREEELGTERCENIQIVPETMACETALRDPVPKVPDLPECKLTGAVPEYCRPVRIEKRDVTFIVRDDQGRIVRDAEGREVKATEKQEVKVYADAEQCADWVDVNDLTDMKIAKTRTEQLLGEETDAAQQMELRDTLKRLDARIAELETQTQGKAVADFPTYCGPLQEAKARYGSSLEWYEHLYDACAKEMQNAVCKEVDEVTDFPAKCPLVQKFRESEAFVRKYVFSDAPKEPQYHLNWIDTDRGAAPRVTRLLGKTSQPKAVGVLTKLGEGVYESKLQTSSDIQTISQNMRTPHAWSNSSVAFGDQVSEQGSGIVTSVPRAPLVESPLSIPHEIAPRPKFSWMEALASWVHESGVPPPPSEHVAAVAVSSPSAQETTLAASASLAMFTNSTADAIDELVSADASWPLFHYVTRAAAAESAFIADLHPQLNVHNTTLKDASHKVYQMVTTHPSAADVAKRALQAPLPPRADFSSGVFQNVTNSLLSIAVDSTNVATQLIRQPHPGLEDTLMSGSLFLQHQEHLNKTVHAYGMCAARTPDDFTKRKETRQVYASLKTAQHVLHRVTDTMGDEVLSTLNFVGSFKNDTASALVTKITDAHETLQSTLAAVDEVVSNFETKFSSDVDVSKPVDTKSLNATWNDFHVGDSFLRTLLETDGPAVLPPFYNTLVHQMGTVEAALESCAVNTSQISLENPLLTYNTVQKFQTSLVSTVDLLETLVEAVNASTVAVEPPPAVVTPTRPTTMEGAVSQFKTATTTILNNVCAVNYVPLFQGFPEGPSIVDVEENASRVRENRVAIEEVKSSLQFITTVLNIEANAWHELATGVVSLPSPEEDLTTELDEMVSMVVNMDVQMSEEELFAREAAIAAAEVALMEQEALERAYTQQLQAELRKEQAPFREALRNRDKAAKAHAAKWRTQKKELARATVKNLESARVQAAQAEKIAKEQRVERRAAVKLLQREGQVMREIRAEREGEVEEPVVESLGELRTVFEKHQKVAEERAAEWRKYQKYRAHQELALQRAIRGKLVVAREQETYKRFAEEQRGMAEEVGVAPLEGFNDIQLAAERISEASQQIAALTQLHLTDLSRFFRSVSTPYRAFVNDLEEATKPLVVELPKLFSPEAVRVTTDQYYGNVTDLVLQNPAVAFAPQTPLDSMKVINKYQQQLWNDVPFSTEAEVLTAIRESAFDEVIAPALPSFWSVANTSSLAPGSYKGVVVTSENAVQGDITVSTTLDGKPLIVTNGTEVGGYESYIAALEAHGPSPALTPLQKQFIQEEIERSLIIDTVLAERLETGGEGPPPGEDDVAVFLDTKHPAMIYNTTLGVVLPADPLDSNLTVSAVKLLVEANQVYQTSLREQLDQEDTRTPVMLFIEEGGDQVATPAAESKLFTPAQIEAISNVCYLGTVEANLTTQLAANRIVAEKAPEAEQVVIQSRLTVLESEIREVQRQKRDAEDEVFEEVENALVPPSESDVFDAAPLPFPAELELDPEGKLSIQFSVSRARARASNIAEAVYGVDGDADAAKELYINIVSNAAVDTYHAIVKKAEEELQARFESGSSLADVKGVYDDAVKAAEELFLRVMDEIRRDAEALVFTGGPTAPVPRESAPFSKSLTKTDVDHMLRQLVSAAESTGSITDTTVTDLLTQVGLQPMVPSTLVAEDASAVTMATDEHADNLVNALMKPAVRGAFYTAGEVIKEAAREVVSATATAVVVPMAISEVVRVAAAKAALSVMTRTEQVERMADLYRFNTITRVSRWKAGGVGGSRLKNIGAVARSLEKELGETPERFWERNYLTSPGLWPLKVAHGLKNVLMAAQAANIVNRHFNIIPSLHVGVRPRNADRLLNAKMNAYAALVDTELKARQNLFRDYNGATQEMIALVARQKRDEISKELKEEYRLTHGVPSANIVSQAADLDTIKASVESIASTSNFAAQQRGDLQSAYLRLRTHVQRGVDVRERYHDVGDDAWTFEQLHEWVNTEPKLNLELNLDKGARGMDVDVAMAKVNEAVESLIASFREDFLRSTGKGAPWFENRWLYSESNNPLVTELFDNIEALRTIQRSLETLIPLKEAAGEELSTAERPRTVESSLISQRRAVVQAELEAARAAALRSREEDGGLEF